MANDQTKEQPVAALSEEDITDLRRILAKLPNEEAKATDEFVDLDNLGTPEERITRLEDVVASLQGAYKTLNKKHSSLLEAHNELVEFIKEMDTELPEEPESERRPAVARVNRPKSRSQDRDQERRVPPEDDENPLTKLPLVGSWFKQA